MTDSGDIQDNAILARRRELSFCEDHAPYKVRGPARNQPQESDRFYTICGFVLLIFVAAIGALHWSLYPVFVDTYYHMAVIEGFKQAGGIITHAFWEMAPGGRAHVYPPTLHAVGCLFTQVGVSPRMFVTFVSWAFYPGCMLTTWLWLRRIAGPPSALFAVVLLCGPATFFWNQSAHTANAAVLVVAPLSLLALETERYLICAVLNFVTISLHPMGLFLPPALVINTVLRRRNILAGFLAAAVPVLLYAPWLAHVWANRVFLSEQRTGVNLALSGPGVNVGLVALVCTALAVPWLILRRAAALTVVGATLGFSAVLPMGLGGRFFMFNIHWPLACLGAIGLGQLAGWVEKHSWLRLGGQVFLLCVAVIGLVAFPSLDLMLGQPGRRAPTDSKMLPKIRPHWQLGLQAGMLPRLMDLDPRIGPEPGAGPGPGLGPMLVPGPRPGQRPGPGKMDMIHQAGATEFFDAVRGNVALGDVIYVNDPPAASLITGVTGRWTSNGMLFDVQPSKELARPEDCDFLAVVGPAAGRGLLAVRPAERSRFEAPVGFEKVFENSFGSLWRNPAAVHQVQQPGRASTSLPLLMAILLVSVLLSAFDLLPALRWNQRMAAVVVGTVVVAACLLPLGRIVVSELMHPPTAPPRRAHPPLPPAIGGEIGRKHEMILDTVRNHKARGASPDYFWPPENEEYFHRLMQQGQFQEADKLLDRALQTIGELLDEGRPRDDAIRQ